jgi:hypothetical protein
MLYMTEADVVYNIISRQLSGSLIHSSTLLYLIGLTLPTTPKNNTNTPLLVVVHIYAFVSQ